MNHSIEYIFFTPRKKIGFKKAPTLIFHRKGHE